MLVAIVSTVGKVIVIIRGKVATSKVDIGLTYHNTVKAK